jgi:hypothetical protein
VILWLKHSISITLTAWRSLSECHLIQDCCCHCYKNPLLKIKNPPGSPESPVYYPPGEACSAVMYWVYDSHPSAIRRSMWILRKYTAGGFCFLILLLCNKGGVTAKENRPQAFFFIKPDNYNKNSKICPVRVTKLSKYGFGIWDPRSGIRKPILDPGAKSQKGTGPRIQIRNTVICTNPDPDPSINEKPWFQLFCNFCMTCYLCWLL